MNRKPEAAAFCCRFLFLGLLSPQGLISLSNSLSARQCRPESEIIKPAGIDKPE
ncbi:MAG TPA: hypothetical protein PKB07_12225 [Flavilitoribacter sp.]|nr:hypothetical protein [Flavilitoribacter sp.]